MELAFSFSFQAKWLAEFASHFAPMADAQNAHLLYHSIDKHLISTKGFADLLERKHSCHLIPYLHFALSAGLSNLNLSQEYAT
jgi:hypothetical protein